MIISKSELKNALILSCKGAFSDLIKMKARGKDVIFNVISHEPHQVELETLKDFSDDKGNVNPIIAGFIEKFHIGLIYPKGKKSTFSELIREIEEMKLKTEDEDKFIKMILDMEEYCAILAKELGYAITLKRMKPKGMK